MSVEAIHKAKRELEEEARERTRAEQEERRKKAEEEGREFKARSNPDDAQPDPKAQRNFTDPESRIMVKGGQVIQGYNVQAAVDAESQIIVAANLTNIASDNPHLLPLVDQIEANTGRLPREVSADAGYFSERNILGLDSRLVDPLISPDRQKHSSWRNAVAPQGREPENVSTAERMRRLLNTRQGRERYKLRRCSVEPVFGQINEARGPRRFLHRGHDKARDSWLFESAVHNVAKLFRAGYRPNPDDRGGTETPGLLQRFENSACSILSFASAGFRLRLSTSHTGC